MKILEKLVVVIVFFIIAGLLLLIWQGLKGAYRIYKQYSLEGGDGITAVKPTKRSYKYH